MSDKKHAVDHVEHDEYAGASGSKHAPAVNEHAILNHLSHFTKEELLADVEGFAQRFNLVEELPLLRKGALLAQRPMEYDMIEELTDEDRANIDYEHKHKWSHPLTLYLTILCCSIGAATQGWDQTGSNGANLSFPQEFGIAEIEGEPNYERNGWLIGLVNAAPYIASSLLGCWLSDPINHYLGRRGCIFITACVLVITPICSGLTQNWQQLFIVRLLLGLGMGAKGATVPIFAAENSPAAIRGALVMGWQLWTAFGIFLGFCANVVVADVGAIAWRLQLGSAFIPAFPLVIGIYFCPESPRWLLKKGRAAEAFKSLRRLRHHDLQAARDLYMINYMVEEEAKIIKAESFVARFVELFTIPRVRRATVASGTIMLAQQMCGINIISFYSSTVFVLSGYSTRNALYASLGFGAVNFVFAFPALITIDTFGRRNLVLSTFPQMAWCLLAAGLSFLIPESAGTAKIGCIAFFIFLFAAFYSVGEGPVPFTYSAEVFPLANREMGMAWAVSTCLFWAAVLSITFPRMVQAMTITGAFCFYAGLNVIAFILIFFLLPETKLRTLEELDDVFSVPSGEFASYQVKEALPYFFKRHVFRNKNAHLRDLYAKEDYDMQPQVRQRALKRDEMDV